jgi:hypothetical protein
MQVPVKRAHGSGSRQRIDSSVTALVAPQPTSENGAQLPLPTPLRDRTALAAVSGALALLGVIVLTIALAAGAFTTAHTTSVTQTVPATGGGTGLNAAGIFAAANPGVVDITARSTTTTPEGPFGLPRQGESTDSGTGLVIGSKGDILTAAS